MEPKLYFKHKICQVRDISGLLPVHQGLRMLEHLAWVGQLFSTVTQGRGKLRPFVKWEDKTVVRAGKKRFVGYSNICEQQASEK